MDNINTAIKDKREYSDLNLKEVEPLTKINLRGKKREFFTKVGQVLSVISVSYTHLTLPTILLV